VPAHLAAAWRIDRILKGSQRIRYVPHIQLVLPQLDHQTIVQANGVCGSDAIGAKDGAVDCREVGLARASGPEAAVAVRSLTEEASIFCVRPSLCRTRF
jgi:hypothetical protein